MEKRIKELFPDLKFIQVLAKEMGGVEKFGLHDILNLTIDTIKSIEKNDIFEAVINEYKTRIINLIQSNISGIKTNILNRLIKELKSDYNSILNEKEFELYIFSLYKNLFQHIQIKKK